LVLVAGIVWSAVGAVLVVVASIWFMDVSRYATLGLAIGITGGAIAYRFMLARLAKNNIARIFALESTTRKFPLNTFQSRRSYILIAIMMAGGYALRHLPIPKLYLAPLYLAMGVALLLSSLHYYLWLNSP